MTNSALVVIDMQNDFIDGALGSVEAQKIVSKVRQCIEEFDGKAIYATMDNHYPENYKEFAEGREIPEHCMNDTEGEKLEPTIEAALYSRQYGKPGSPPEGVAYFHKEAFGSLTLANVLYEDVEDYDINTIYIVGLCTDICVLSNALMLRAACPRANIVVFEDCCAGSSLENHYNALRLMEINCITIDKYQLDF